MKANKKVIDSIAVASLAIALSITAVTTNGLSTVRTNDTENTQLEPNGIAGVAATMSEYELEAADLLDQYVSVEKKQVNLVASAVNTVTEEEPSEAEAVAEMTEDTEQKEKKTPVSPQEKEWEDKLMADVDDFLYVRAKADADSDIVGKMRKGDRAVVKKAGSEWTRIESGSVKGYVKNEYCVTGTDAYKYAKKHCDTVAKAEKDGLRVRKAPSTDAEVVKAVAAGESFTVDKKANKHEGWVAVKTDSSTCYVSADYVDVSLKTGKAITLEEEQAALQAKKEQAAASAAKKDQSGNGQTASSGSSTGASLAASADEETLLAALVQCEAGGCGVECMTAVGAVVVNRVRSGNYPNSIYNVIYQRGQFGPASSGRLESRLASGVSAGARQAARAALAGSDPTGGAKSFKLASGGHAGVVIGPIVFF